MIYLDYAASCPPFAEIVAHAAHISKNFYANPSALHQAGSSARVIVQQSRKSLAQSLHVRPEEIFFTSGGTEANNWAIKTSCISSGKRHIVCSATEHSSVLEAVKSMARNGFRITWIHPNSEGIIDANTVAAAIQHDTGLLCVHAVNNETGVLQDVDELAAVAHQAGVAYLCDGVQSFGHVAQNLQKADFISLSAHKLGGPRGIGCLIIKQPHNLPPLIDGGKQEFALRSGTENVPGIAGFALAAQLSLSAMDEEAPRIQALTQQLQNGLLDVHSGTQFAGGNQPRSPGILCCRIPGISGEEMVIRLSEHGICVSPGAACASGSKKPSHVLLAMGYSPAEASEFFRFSLGRNTTQAEIETTLDVISRILL